MSTFSGSVSRARVGKTSALSTPISERRPQRRADPVEREAVEELGEQEQHSASTTTTTSERRSACRGSRSTSDAGLGSMSMAKHPASPGGADEPAGPVIANADAVIVQRHEPTLRGILRVVATVVASAIALYLIYLLRTPLGWLFVATFVAVSVAAPVQPARAADAARRRDRARLPRPGADPDRDRGDPRPARRRPPAATSSTTCPSTSSDLNETVQENDTLREPQRGLRPRRQARRCRQRRRRLARRVAGTLADIGAGLVSSLFALFTILVMSIFMVARGRDWTDALLATGRPERGGGARRALDRMAVAVSGYIGGALAQATVAGIVAFIVLVDPRRAGAAARSR